MEIGKGKTQKKEQAFWDSTSEDTATGEKAEPEHRVLSLDRSKGMRVSRQITLHWGGMDGPDDSSSQLHCNPPALVNPMDQIALRIQEGKEEDELSINQPKGEEQVMNSSAGLKTHSGRGIIGSSLIQEEIDGSGHKRVEARDAGATTEPAQAHIG